MSGEVVPSDGRSEEPSTTATPLEMAYLTVALHSLSQAKEIAYEHAWAGEAFSIVAHPYRTAEDALILLLTQAKNSQNNPDTA